MLHKKNKALFYKVNSLKQTINLSNEKYATIHAKTNNLYQIIHKLENISSQKKLIKIFKLISSILIVATNTFDLFTGIYNYYKYGDISTKTFFTKKNREII